MRSNAFKLKNCGCIFLTPLEEKGMERMQDWVKETPMLPPRSLLICPTLNSRYDGVVYQLFGFVIYVWRKNFRLSASQIDFAIGYLILMHTQYIGGGGDLFLFSPVDRSKQWLFSFNMHSRMTSNKWTHKSRNSNLTSIMFSQKKWNESQQK